MKNGVKLGIVLAIAGLLGGCNKGQPDPKVVQQVTSTAVLTAKDALCVLMHDQEPVPQIIVDCGLVQDAANDVTIWTSASRQAAAQKAAKR